MVTDESLGFEPAAEGNSRPMVPVGHLRIIHDELVFDLHPEEEQELVPKILHRMETALPLPHGVPILVEGDGEKLAGCALSSGWRLRRPWKRVFFTAGEDTRLNSRRGDAPTPPRGLGGLLFLAGTHLAIFGNELPSERFRKTYLSSMPDFARKPIVVTDLDGTLMDHHTYGYEPVVPLLKKLKASGIPVIANTSKTRSEWLKLAEDLGNDDAFVVENGSAIYFSDGECVVFGERQERILECLSGLREKYDFASYVDLGVAGIAAATGLDLESAKRSSEREFSEPVIWNGSEEDKKNFISETHSAGFATLQGGRFLHVLGPTDKGKAVEYLRQRFPKYSPVIALGDGPNDIAMLKAADIGIVIASPTGREIHFDSTNRIIRSTLEGPEGWAETMSPLLDTFLTT